MEIALHRLERFVQEDMPEFALACACCGWPLTEARLHAIRTAAGRIADWDRFQRVVERHRIAGLVFNALVQCGVCMPDPARARLEASAREIARQNLIMSSETLRLQHLFDENGIPVLFIKGVTLAQLAYGSLSLKHSIDIDFLVLPDDARRAYGLLEEAGYESPSGPLSKIQRRAMFRGSNEAGLVRKSDGLKIELHWALTENPLLLRGVNALSPAQDVQLGAGQCARTLANEDLFAYLCVHGAYHAWMRLKWLADFHALIATMADCDLERLYRLADAKGAGPSAGQALLLAKELLGLGLPKTLEAELRRSRRVRVLLSVARTSLTGDDCQAEVIDRPFATLRISLSHFILMRGWRYILTQIRTVLFTPRDVIDYPLPSFLFFAYPLLRVPLHIWRLVLYRGRGAPSPSARKT